MIAEVLMWGRTIGAVALEADREVAAFEYAPAFAGSGIEISRSCRARHFTACRVCSLIRCLTSSATP
jgi:hypothetical protein